MPNTKIDMDFRQRLSGAGLLTTQVLYHLPDHPGLLQTFVWQTLDTAPGFPRLARFLEHWRTEIEAMIHSIRIAHSDWVGPAELRAIDGEFRLN